MGRCSDDSIILCSQKYYVAKILFMLKKERSYILLFQFCYLHIFLFFAKELEKKSLRTTQTLFHLNILLKYYYI